MTEPAITEACLLMSADDIQAALERSPFAAFLGLRVVSADHAGQSLNILMSIRPALTRNDAGMQAHGGAIASLIDIAGDFAAAMLIGRALPTANLRVDYLRPARGGELNALARVRRLGRSICVVDVDVSESQAELIAIGRASYVSARGDQAANGGQR